MIEVEGIEVKSFVDFLFEWAVSYAKAAGEVALIIVALSIVEHLTGAMPIQTPLGNTTVSALIDIGVFITIFELVTWQLASAAWGAMKFAVSTPTRAIGAGLLVGAFLWWCK